MHMGLFFSTKGDTRYAKSIVPGYHLRQKFLGPALDAIPGRMDTTVLPVLIGTNVVNVLFPVIR